MAQSSQLPKFGDWESEENVPYTEYFDNARKKKGSGRKNPKDRQDNTPPDPAPPLKQELELKGQKETAVSRSKNEHRTSHEDGQTNAVDLPHQPYGLRSGSVKGESKAPKGLDMVRPKHELQLSREEGDLRRPTDSLSHRHGSQSTSETPKRVSRPSAGSDRSIDQSPLNPHYQAKMAGKVGGVPSSAWEKKGSSEGIHGLAPSTPGRSRLRSVTGGDGTPDNGPAVPKFGDWDESNPASAEGYTDIFNRVREEKQIGAGKVPVTATEASYSNGQKQYRNDSSKSCCCFPWGGK